MSRNTFQCLFPSISYAIRKIIRRNLNYVQYLNTAQIEKAWFMTPIIAVMKKAIWAQKTWFYGNLFFKMLFVMIKD